MLAILCLNSERPVDLACFGPFLSADATLSCQSYHNVHHASFNQFNVIYITKIVDSHNVFCKPLNKMFFISGTLGCFVDKNYSDLDEANNIGPKMTASKCNQYCRNFKSKCCLICFSTALQLKLNLMNVGTE